MLQLSHKLLMSENFFNILHLYNIQSFIIQAKSKDVVGKLINDAFNYRNGKGLFKNLLMIMLNFIRVALEILSTSCSTTFRDCKSVITNCRLH